MLDRLLWDRERAVAFRALDCPARSSGLRGERGPQPHTTLTAMALFSRQS